MARGEAAKSSVSGSECKSAQQNLQRAIAREQSAEDAGRREKAEKRAAAAELIAQEANAVRLQALLDAAREQAAERTIETAEKRFAVAKGTWEAAHRPFSVQDDEAARDFGDAAGRYRAEDGSGEDAWAVSHAAAPAGGQPWMSIPRMATAATVAAAVVAAGVLFSTAPDDNAGSDVAIAQGQPSRSDATAVSATAPTQVRVEAPVLMQPAAVVTDTPLPEAQEPAAAEAATDALASSGAPKPAPAKSVAMTPASEPKAAKTSAPARTVATTPEPVEAPATKTVAVRRQLDPVPTPGRNPFHADAATTDRDRPAPVHADVTLQFHPE